MLRADRTACIVLMLPDEAVFECCSAALERKSAGGRERDSEAERVEGDACVHRRPRPRTKIRHKYTCICITPLFPSPHPPPTQVV